MSVPAFNVGRGWVSDVDDSDNWTVGMNALVMIQTPDDYDATAEFIAKYGWTSPDFEHTLERLSDVLMDIESIYSAEKTVRNM